MGGYGRWRRPKVGKLAERHNTRRLLRALHYRDVVADNRDRLFDLGAPIRRDAARALAFETNPNGFDIDAALIEAFADPFSEVRAAAAGSLAARRARRAVPALAHGAVTWSDDRAVAAATDALIDLGSKEALDQVAGELLRQPQTSARAGEVMRRMVAAAGPEAARGTAQAVARTLRSARPEVASRASDVLVRLGAPSVEPLLEVLEEQGPAQVLTIAALGRLGDLRASRPLVEQLTDGDADVRAAAAAALGHLADPSVVRALRRLTMDSDPGVRAAALGSLRRLVPITALELDDGDLGLGDGRLVPLDGGSRLRGSDEGRESVAAAVGDQ